MSRFVLTVLSCWFSLQTPVGLATEESETFIQAQQRRCNSLPLDQPRPDVKTYLLDINACVQEGQYQQALRLSLHAKAAAQAAHDSEGWLQSLNAEASVLFYLGALSEALSRYEGIRQAWVPGQDQKLILNAENNAAALLNQMGRPEEARPLAESALARAVQQKNDIYIGSVSGTLASSLTQLQQFSRARKLLADCLQIGQHNNVSLLIVGCAQVEAEMHAAQKLWQASLDAAERGLFAAQQQHLQSQTPDLLLSKAIALRALHQADAALLAARLGLDTALKTEKLHTAQQLWQLVADLHTEQHDLGAALQAQRQATLLSQKIFDQKLASIAAAQRVTGEIERKEHEITLLKSEHDVQLARIAATQAQRTTTIMVSLLMIAAFVIGVGRWIYQRDLARAQKTHAELNQLHTLKDQFLANTSHELRTPLNGIIGLSDDLLVNGRQTLPADALEHLTMIQDCGTQLLQIVDDILDFSRLRADKLVLRREAVSLPQVAHDVIRLLNPLAKSKQLVLRADFSPDLPQVLADPDRIRQVLMNLVGNAIKFTYNGEIVVTAQYENDQVIVHVRDTGIGIPVEKQVSIFEPFEQVDGSKSRRYGGTGLGLAIARALIRAHGGELSVQSELRHGSDFLFNLPIEKGR